jgi:hypothetical protein
MPRGRHPCDVPLSRIRKCKFCSRSRRREPRHTTGAALCRVRDGARGTCQKRPPGRVAASSPQARVRDTQGGSRAHLGVGPRGRSREASASVLSVGRCIAKSARASAGIQANNCQTRRVHPATLRRRIARWIACCTGLTAFAPGISRTRLAQSHTGREMRDRDRDEWTCRIRRVRSGRGERE